MKLNWGHGIIIAFILFMSFILYFVITITLQPKYAYDLVDEEYYKTELKYQEEIDKLENTKNLSSEIHIIKSGKGLEISFPKEINEATTGVISFYRPSTKVLDFKLPLTISSNKTIVLHDNLISGNWNINIEFTSNSTEYLFKKSFTY